MYFYKLCVSLEAITMAFRGSVGFESRNTYQRCVCATLFIFQEPRYLHFAHLRQSGLGALLRRAILMREMPLTLRHAISSTVRDVPVCLLTRLQHQSPHVVRTGQRDLAA